MSPDQFAELLGALDKHTIALAIAAVAASLTAAAAMSALALAWGQIRAARSGIKSTFILEFDRRWEGEMKPVRAKFLKMRTEIKDRVHSQYSNLNAEDTEAKMGDECSKHLHSFRSENPAEYNDLMSIVGFFETVGYSIHKNHIPVDDVSDLFGEAIRDLDRLFWKHIQKRIEESKNDDAAGKTTLFEHACSLICHNRDWYAARKT